MTDDACLKDRIISAAVEENGLHRLVKDQAEPNEALKWP